MKLFSFLVRCNVRKSLIVAALSVVSGLGSAALIATVNSGLHLGAGSQRSKALLAIALAATLAAKIGGSLASSLLLGRLSQESILNLCCGLCRKIAATPFRELEVIGAPRILTCLTEDVNTLSGAIQAMPLILINSVVLAGCVIYLAWISTIAVLLLTVVMGVAAFCYRIFISQAFPAVRNARLGKETLFRHFRSLTDGIKELKLHRGRREAFFREDIDAAAEYYRAQNVISLNRYALADGWSQLMFGILLATLLFAIPAFSHITEPDLIRYVLVAIYAMSPAWNLIRALPSLASGEASLERMHELGLTLDTMASPPASSGAAPLREPGRTPPLVEFRGVRFAYAESDRGGFSLGPIDLVLHPGELTFVIGGNGSGKSSFVKLLTGLYKPDSGDICVDGRRLSTMDQEAYQQFFSVVYSDFFLFDRLLGIGATDLQGDAKKYLAALDLSDKVKMEGNSFSTTSLSQGQRRRLALLSAYMEDRPIYVLDEWAADQDPIFREVFYLKLLPELKSRGKTVVVVTHDDRYFHLGDQIVKLDCGRVIQTVHTATAAATA